MTDWDHHIQSVRRVYRGYGLRVSEDVYEAVLGQSFHSPEARAQIVLDHALRQGGLGMHWTTHRGEAAGFAGMAADEGDIRVIIEAAPPFPEDVLVGEEALGYGIQPYHPSRGEQEIPVRPGAPMQITYVEWASGGPRPFLRSDDGGGWRGAEVSGMTRRASKVGAWSPTEEFAHIPGEDVSPEARRCYLDEGLYMAEGPALSEHQVAQVISQVISRLFRGDSYAPKLTFEFDSNLPPGNGGTTGDSNMWSRPHMKLSSHATLGLVLHELAHTVVGYIATNPFDTPARVLNTFGLPSWRDDYSGLRSSIEGIRQQDSHGQFFLRVRDHIRAEWSSVFGRQFVGARVAFDADAARLAMADRSGIPGVDRLIEEFLRQPDIRSLRDPDWSHGQCQVISEQFAEFANARGMKAYTNDVYLDEIGYQIQPGSQGGEIGFDENDEMQYGHYPEHTVVALYPNPDQPYGGHPVFVDFTASQYGYTDLPKVFSSLTAALDDDDPPGWVEAKVASSGWPASIPASDRAILEQRGVKIQQTDERFAPAWYDSSDRTIYYRLDSLGRGINDATLVHEVGHAIDHALGWLSESQAFKAVVKQYDIPKIQGGHRGLSLWKEVWAWGYAALYGNETPMWWPGNDSDLARVIRDARTPRDRAVTGSVEWNPASIPVDQEVEVSVRDLAESRYIRRNERDPLKGGRASPIMDSFLDEEVPGHGLSLSYGDLTRDELSDRKGKSYEIWVKYRGQHGEDRKQWPQWARDAYLAEIRDPSVQTTSISGEDYLKGIANSIKSRGQQTPLLLKEESAGQWWLAEGNHRLAAALRYGISTLRVKRLRGYTASGGTAKEAYSPPSTTQTLEDGTEVWFDFGGDAVGGGQYNGWAAAYIDGRKAGYLDWSLWEDEFSVRMVEVEPEFRRKGLATLMLDWVKKTQDVEDAKVNFGMTTPDGTGWVRSLGALDDYAGQHRPPRDAAPLHDLTDDPNSWMPDDVYTHPQYYAFGDPIIQRESIEVIRRVRGNPDARVTIYRAAPPWVDTIDTGNWVALSESYARQHGMEKVREYWDPELEWRVGDHKDKGSWVPYDDPRDWPVLSATVRAADVRNGGNDIIEWGYWGQPLKARVVPGDRPPDRGHYLQHPDRGGFRASKQAGMSWTIGPDESERCTQTVLMQFGVFDECPRDGGGLLGVLMKHGWTYRRVEDDRGDMYEGTVRSFYEDHRFQVGKYYIFSSGHAMAMIDGTLIDSEGRGPDGRRLLGAYEIYRKGDKPVGGWFIASKVNATSKQAGRTSGALYHLADDVDFRLDPTRRPQNNTTLGGDWPEPGIFLTDSPEHWLNGYGYWRPWVVEFDVPSNSEAKDYGRETFIPATMFDRVRITRVLPLDAYCREEYGDYGWTERHFETTFDTNEPIPEEDENNYFRWRGWRYPGDARQESASWRSQYAKRVRRFARESGRGGVYAKLDDDDPPGWIEAKVARYRSEGDSVASRDIGYHQTKVENRESILRSGLEAGRSAKGKNFRVYVDRIRCDPEIRLDTGPKDLWEVDFTGLPHRPDPPAPDRWVIIEADVPPERLRLVATTEGGVARKLAGQAKTYNVYGNPKLSFDGPLYHGSNSEFSAGDLIGPSRGEHPSIGYSNPNKVYASAWIETAGSFGDYIYEVEPTGTLTPDPWFEPPAEWMGGGKPTSVISDHPLRVIRKLDESEVERGAFYFGSKEASSDWRTFDGGEGLIVKLQHIEAYGANHIMGRFMGRVIASLVWRDGVISDVEVEAQYRRKGIATAMLEWAREITPGLQHSDKLLPDGKAWSEVVGMAGIDPSAHEPFRDRLGRCYELAGRYVMDNSGTTLVHGSIQGQGNPRIGHAWAVDDDGEIFEPTSGTWWEAHVFQQFYNAITYHVYEWTEAMKKMVEHGHWGPWHETTGRSGLPARIGGVKKISAWHSHLSEEDARRTLYGTEAQYRGSGGPLSIGAATNLLRRIMRGEGEEQWGDPEYGAYVQRDYGRYHEAVLGWDFDTTPPIPFISAGAGTPDATTVIHEAAHMILNRGAHQQGWKAAHDDDFISKFQDLLRKWGDRSLAGALGMLDQVTLKPTAVIDAGTDDVDDGWVEVGVA